MKEEREFENDEGMSGKRRRGMTGARWLNNINDWTRSPQLYQHMKYSYRKKQIVRRPYGAT